MQFLLGFEKSGGIDVPILTNPKPVIIFNAPETLTRLFLDAAHQGHTVSFFGNAQTVVPFLPKHRLQHTILFELSDTRPLGFNPLHSLDTASTVSDAIAVTWPTDIKTTQLDRYLIPACRALAEIGGTLFQLPYLFSSETFRHAVIARIKDPAIRYELEEYDRKKDRDQDDQTNSLQNRFVVMKTDPDVRRILSQKSIIENPGIMIVDMPAGEHFDFIAAIVLATMTGVAFIERPLFHLGKSIPVIACNYIDELPKDLWRKHQNSATILSTRLGIKDATELEDYYAVDPGNINLLELQDGQALVKTDRTHQITLPTHSYPARPSNLRRIRANTETRYGAPASHVDDKIKSFIDGL